MGRERTGCGQQYRGILVERVSWLGVAGTVWGVRAVKARVKGLCKEADLTRAPGVVSNQHLCQLALTSCHQRINNGVILHNIRYYFSFRNVTLKTR